MVFKAPLVAEFALYARDYFEDTVSKKFGDEALKGSSRETQIGVGISDEDIKRSETSFNHFLLPARNIRLK